MITLTRLRLSILVILAIVSGEILPSRNQLSLAAAVTVQPDVNSESIAPILQIEGQVQVQRAQEQVFVPEVATSLYETDVLQVGTSSRVVIQCNDHSIQIVNTNLVALNELCPARIAKVTCTQGTIGCPHRGDTDDFDPMIPYVMSPRRTKLLNPQPRLHWHPISGATSYTLRLEGNGSTLWERTGITGSSMSYPRDVPPLQLGVTYRLVVEADTGQSSLADSPIVGGTGFMLLGLEQQQTVNARREQIQKAGLSSQAEALALAQLYLDFYLFAEGIEILEKLEKTGITKTLVERKLADIYRNQLQLPEGLITDRN